MAKKRKIVRGVEYGNHPCDALITMDLSKQWGQRHIVIVFDDNKIVAQPFKNLPAARQFVINNFRNVL